MEQSLLPSVDDREEHPRCPDDISRLFWDTVEALCYGDEDNSDYDEQDPLNTRDHGGPAGEVPKAESDERRGSISPFGDEVASGVVSPDNKREIPGPFHQQSTSEQFSLHTEQDEPGITHHNELVPIQSLNNRSMSPAEGMVSEADLELQSDGTQKSSCGSSIVAVDSSSQSEKAATNYSEYRASAEPRPSSKPCESETRHLLSTEPSQQSDDEWRELAFRALLVAQSACSQKLARRRAIFSRISVPYGGDRSSSNAPTSSSSSGAGNRSSNPPSSYAEQRRPSATSPRGLLGGEMADKDLSQRALTPPKLSHPWAHLVQPRHLRRHEIDPLQVTNILPEDRYRPIPSAGYLSLKFCHSLFPHVRPTNGILTAEILFLELPSLEDAIAFRSDTEQVIQRTFDGGVEPVSQPPPESIAKKTRWTSCLFPRPLDGKWPVLYQVVAVISNSLVLEAKDFFVFLPDRRELHCILLDRFAYNVESGKYGYDRQLVSVRDFVWVYDLMPVQAALASPEAHLHRARMRRTAALDHDAKFFFRAARFAFVTPPVWGELRYGFVLSATRRGTFINNYKMAFEGAPEAVTITRSLAHFSWLNLREGAMMKALCRQKSSCAVRFSEPPVSVQARDQLCQYVKLFLPANPDEAVVPLEVHKLTPRESAWLADRLADFNSYRSSRDEAVLTMAKVFRAASSALASYATADDDKRIHRVTATIPNLMDYPVRLEFLLNDMTSEAGWVRHRSAGVWITEASLFIRMEVDRVEQLREARQLRITLQAYTWTNQSVMRRAADQVGRVAGNSALLEVCVKLEKRASCAIPAYEAVTGMDLLNDIPADSVGRTILDIVYGAAEPQEDASSLFVVDEAPIILKGRIVQLTDDQRQALAMGYTPFPIAGIQAAFGTGKTIVGSCIAAQQAKLGRKVIVTATTNAAVAQFTEAILSLGDFTDVPFFRYIAEAIIFDETTISTAVDMHVVLKKLADIYKGELSREDLAACKRFREGRRLFENHMSNRDQERCLMEQEREQLILAERDVSELIDKVVRVMFEKLQPRIVAITTSSLLNATERQGIFNGYLDDFSLIICDEASLAPEPVFAAILSRFPKMRQIYIGDVHMLEPHVTCSRHAEVVKYGACSIMDVLSSSGRVPIAQLTTTFRAHPQLNSLPNRLFYGGALRDGTPAAHRRMLLDVMHFPNAELPFMFIDVNGASTRAQSHSYYNVEEAEVCLTLVNRLRLRGIASESICIISFYKEQHRRLADYAHSSGVELSTVDAIQGREKDVVVLLTTKTDFSRQGSEFLDDPRRINVALTRCRHGQFVLGHEPSLSVVPVWRSVITWAKERDAVVSAESWENFFP